MAEPAQESDGLTEQESFETVERQNDVPVTEELTPAEDRFARMEEIAARNAPEPTNEPVEEPITEEEGVEEVQEELVLETKEPTEEPVVEEPEQEEKQTKQYNLNVYGQDQKVSYDKMKDLAERAAGAQHQYDAAAQMMKEAQELKAKYEQIEKGLAPRLDAQTSLPVQDVRNNQLPVSDVGSSALPVQDAQPQEDPFELFRKAEYEDDAEARRRFNEMFRPQQPVNPALPQTEVERIAEEKAQLHVQQMLAKQEIDRANEQIIEQYGDFFSDQKHLNYANFELTQLRQQEPGFSESHYMLKAASNAADMFGYSQQKKQEESVRSKTEAKQRHASVNNLSTSARAVSEGQPEETHQSIVAQMRDSRRSGFG